MRVREFYRVLKEEILKNKILMVCLSLVTAGAYGFAITHYSIGVDDPAAFRYVHSYGASSLVDQGRLLHLLLDKLTGYVEFTPFGSLSPYCCFLPRLCCGAPCWRQSAKKRRRPQRR